MCQTATHFLASTVVCTEKNTSTSGEGLGDVALSPSVDEAVTQAEAVSFSFVVRMRYDESNRPSRWPGAG